MKNWEKWEKEIKEYGVHHISLKNDKIVSCRDCDLCQFSSQHNNGEPCGKTIANWLYKEAPIWEDVKVDSPIIVDDNFRRYFARYDKASKTVGYFSGGATSWSKGDNGIVYVNENRCKLAK